MKLAFIIIYVFFISATGLTAQNAISDDILYDDINSLYGWDNPELLNNDCRNTQQTAIDSHSATTSGCLFDDCLFSTKPETALLTFDPGATKGLDYFDDKWTKLEGLGYHAMSAEAEISATDSGRDGELANNPRPSSIYYDDVVSWIEDAYHTWVARRPLWVYPPAPFKFWISRSYRNQEKI